MALNVSQLAQGIGDAFIGSLKQSVPGIKDFAQSESQKLAQTLVMIETLKLTGKIDETEARLHLEIQKNATRTVFLTLKGLGILAAEQAINAALNVVRSTVNTAVGFALV
jgi:hypothetical protein